VWVTCSARLSKSFTESTRGFRFHPQRIPRRLHSI
jgi:hypothetical protein